MPVSKCSIGKIVQVKVLSGVCSWQQTLLATLLKLLQLLALLCNRTSSYVLKCVPVSCVHVEHLSNTDSDVVLCMYILLSPPERGVWFGSFTVAKCIPVQDAFISRETGFVHLR